MSRALLLILAFVLGLVTGVLLATYFLRNKRSKT
jgi:LPS O-antigen subunit length determinant protein (WzzB/FepE family)